MAQAEAEPDLAEGDVFALARRYVPEARTVTPVPKAGADHVVYFVDESVVLKLPRPDGNAAWLAREALILQTLANTPGPADA